MPIRVDHIGIPCRDPEASARFLAGLFALPIEPDGPNDEFRCVLLDGGTRLVFQPAVVDALRAGAVAYGNDPEATSNGESHDPLGGRGRVFFRDPDGHLFEACC